MLTINSSVSKIIEEKISAISPRNIPVVSASKSFYNIARNSHVLVDEYDFFTLKPKTWRENLMWELKKMVLRNKKRYGDEIKNMENTVKPLLKSSDQVDDFITKYRENKKNHE